MRAIGAAMEQNDSATARGLLFGSSKKQLRHCGLKPPPLRFASAAKSGGEQPTANGCERTPSKRKTNVSASLSFSLFFCTYLSSYLSLLCFAIREWRGCPHLPRGLPFRKDLESFFVKLVWRWSLNLLEQWFLFLIDFFRNNNPSARDLPRSFRED